LKKLLNDLELWLYHRIKHCQGLKSIFFWIYDEIGVDFGSVK
jgi:hypothetical protein